MVRLALRFDMRAPGFGAPRDRLYREMLNICSWADEQGFDVVRLSEHHASEDGYLPAPLILAAAVAARTKSLRLSIAALILPFHDPLVVAEQVAVLDWISNGRVDLTLAAGYVPAELSMFNIDPKQRAKLLEAKIAVLKNAWTGEYFDYEGRSVRVRPTPVQKPHPPLWLGGSTPAAARRAARIANGFDTHLPDLYEIYCEEARKLGATPAPWRKSGPTFLHVTRDPDADWKRIAPHALHETNAYGEWASQTGLDSSYKKMSDADELRASGGYAVMTPEQCIELADSLQPDGLMIFHPLVGGLDPDFSWQSLKLFASEVLPHLRKSESL